jgi:hypothetical protein
MPWKWWFHGKHYRKTHRKMVISWWFYGVLAVHQFCCYIYIYSISHDICTKWLVSSPFWRLKSTRPFAVLSHLHHKASQPRRKYPLNIDYRCHPLTFTSINIH